MEATSVRLGAVTGLLEPCGLNGRGSFGEIEKTGNMMMIPVQVIAFVEGERTMTQSNKPDAANTAMASRLQAGHQRRGVADTGC